MFSPSSIQCEYAAHWEHFGHAMLTHCLPLSFNHNCWAAAELPVLQVNATLLLENCRYLIYSLATQSLFLFLHWGKQPRISSRLANPPAWKSFESIVIISLQQLSSVTLFHCKIQACVWIPTLNVLSLPIKMALTLPPSIHECTSHNLQEQSDHRDVYNFLPRLSILLITSTKDVSLFGFEGSQRKKENHM
jgi:hypothetical protein